MGTKKAARSPIGKKATDAEGGGKERESSAALTDRDVCGKCGHVHDGCMAHTRHGPNTGKPCGMKPRLGALLCVKHGGNHPDHKQKAKDRLLAMVDPALVELRKIIDNKYTSDADKLRAIQMVLDRTGFKPGVEVTVGVSKWDALFDHAVGQVEVDRDLPAGNSPSALPSPDDDADHSWEDYQQAATDLQADAWRDLDAEDAHEYEAGRIRPDENTVPGEVVSILPDSPTTRGVPSEHDPLAWPYRDRKPT